MPSTYEINNNELTIMNNRKITPTILRPLYRTTYIAPAKKWRIVPYALADNN